MLWFDSASDAIIVSGLGMRPLLAAMLPLEAVVIELASERDLGLGRRSCGGLGR